MITRYLIAFSGAAGITLGLFFFMNNVSERMQVGDGTLYFKITDFIPAPDPGRQLPGAPVLPELRPGVVDLEYEGDTDKASVDFVPSAVEVGASTIETDQPQEPTE